MRAGRLDRRITLQAGEETRDAMGGVTTTWSDLAEDLPAGVRWLRGRDAFAGDIKIGEVDAAFTIRWRADATRTTRILYDDQTFDVIRAAELGRRDGIELLGRIVRAPAV